MRIPSPVAWEGDNDRRHMGGVRTQAAVPAVTISASLTSKPARGKVLCVPRGYETIQQAVDAASDGDCIALGNGVHNLTEPLLIDKCVHVICGDEGSTGVTIRLDATSGGMLLPCSHMIVLDCESCRIADVTIEHLGVRKNTEELTFAVWCRRGNAVLDQCRITSSMHSAIGVNGGTFPTFKRCDVTAREYGAWVSDQGRLRLDRCKLTAETGCSFEDCGCGEVDTCRFTRCGVGVECFVSCEATVKGCTFTDCTGAGVYCTGGAGTHAHETIQIDTNTFAWTGTQPQLSSAQAPSEDEKGAAASAASASVPAPVARGVVVDAAEPVIHKNTFNGCSLVVQNGGAGTCTNNVISGSTVGADVRGKSNPSFRFNTFENCETGVLVSGKLTQGTFTSNNFEGNADAVRVTELANPSLVANTIKKSTTGVHIEDCGRGNVRGNDIVACKTGLSIVSGADPLVDQNQITSCACGVAVSEAKGKIVGNVISRTEETAVVLSAARGSHIEDNVVQDCGKEGFLVSRASAACILNNKVHGSKLAPLHCSEDSKLSIQMQGNELLKAVS